MLPGRFAEDSFHYRRRTSVGSVVEFCSHGDFVPLVYMVRDRGEFVGYTLDRIRSEYQPQGECGDSTALIIASAVLRGSPGRFPFRSPMVLMAQPAVSV